MRGPSVVTTTSTLTTTTAVTRTTTLTRTITTTTTTAASTPNTVAAAADPASSGDEFGWFGAPIAAAGGTAKSAGERKRKTAYAALLSAAEPMGVPKEKTKAPRAIRFSDPYAHLRTDENRHLRAYVPPTAAQLAGECSESNSHSSEEEDSPALQQNALSISGANFEEEEEHSSVITYGGRRGRGSNDDSPSPARRRRATRGRAGRAPRGGANGDSDATGGGNAIGAARRRQ